MIYIGMITLFVALYSIFTEPSFFGFFLAILGVIFILQTFMGHAQHGKRQRY
jgi:uncharacterized membrane protein HdeD (DUF308 family)